MGHKLWHNFLCEYYGIILHIKEFLGFLKSFALIKIKMKNHSKWIKLLINNFIDEKVYCSFKRVFKLIRYKL